MIYLACNFVRTVTTDSKFFGKFNHTLRSYILITFLRLNNTKILEVERIMLTKLKIAGVLSKL